MKTGVGIFRTVFLPFQKLPLGFHYAWGRVFSWLAYAVFAYRREVVTVNVARSFPEKKSWEIRDTVRGFYRHFGEILAEAVWFGGCRGNAGRLGKQRICTVTNPGILDMARDGGGSVMILTSHLGNWELLGGIVEFFEGKTSLAADDFIVVYKRLNSKFWNDFIALNRLAVLDGYGGYTESSAVLRRAVSLRKERKLFIFPTDQFPYRGAACHEIPSFMNQVTQVMTGGAALASKLGMSVMYLGMNRSGRGAYEMTFTEICRDASLMTPHAIMTEYYRLLEADIRRDPANYLWSHNRWK